MPFWQNDPEFDTPEKRGAIISQAVRKQYEMIQKEVTDPVCCMALYGELVELYQNGYIQVPDSVIKVWADNGNEKMVSRRQGNENGRIPSLPDAKGKGLHGIYYHITFHYFYLQTSNHLTMTPQQPEIIVDEISEAFQKEADDYLMLNCGNIRQHLYPLDMVSELWMNGTVEADRHLPTFIDRLYSAKRQEIVKLYRQYFEKAISYGFHEDERRVKSFITIMHGESLNIG